MWEIPEFDSSIKTERAVLRELDKIAGGRLTPDEAADLAVRTRPVVEEQSRVVDIDEYDPRPHHVFMAAVKRAGEAGGKHFTEWIPVLDELRKANADDQALPILLACIDAAERDGRASGRRPAPAYTERAAIIYRRRKDKAAEIAVLERYVAACPGLVAPKIVKRLAALRERPALG